MIDWPGTQDGVSMPVRNDRAPSDRSLFENGLSGITSYMAREGITDPRKAFQSYEEDARQYHNQRRHFTGIDFDHYLIEKAAGKARKYNRIFPGIDEKRDRETSRVYAEAYRKKKDGE